MPDISGVTGFTNYANQVSTRTVGGGGAMSIAGTGSGGGLSINDFYKLLAAQIQYQDADNPMDTSQMMAQMVQTQMISAITQMSQVNTITYANSLVGKEVVMAEVDELTGQFTGEHTKGKIEGLIMGDNPIIFVNGKAYSLSQIMTIGEVPEDFLDPDKDPEEKPEETPETE